MTGDKQNISDIPYLEYEAIKKSLGLRDNLNGKYFDKDKNEILYAKFKRLILDEYNSRKANNNKPKYNFTQEESDDIDKTLGVTYDKEAERKEKERVEALGRAVANLPREDVVMQMMRRIAWGGEGVTVKIVCLFDVVIWQKWQDT